MKKINFNVSDDLAKSIDIAAHANLKSTSEYIRHLIINDLYEHGALALGGEYTFSYKGFFVEQE